MQTEFIASVEKQQIPVNKLGRSVLSFIYSINFDIKEFFYRLHEEKRQKEATFWRNESLLSTEKDEERKHLNKFYRCKSMRPEGINP